MTLPLRSAALNQALAYAGKGVTEIGGNNRGPEIEHFLRSVGANAGDPWCAAFVSCCLQEAAMSLRPDHAGDFAWARRWVSSNFVKLSASVEEMARDAQMRGIWKGADWQAKPGSLVCYRFVKGHHIGFVKGTHGGNLWTVEGNTVSDTGNQRDGDGVYTRKRPLTYVWGFIDLGDS